MTKIDKLVEDFLAQKKIAVVGVSERRETGCNLSYRKFKAAGYRVFAVNPRLTRFEDDPCYPNLTSIPEKPDAVFILANPEVTEGVVRECIWVGIKHVWMHCMMGTKPGLTKKIRVLNQGYVGATTQKALQIVGDSVFAKNPALVLLEFGANDLLLRQEVQLVEECLGRLVDTLALVGSKIIFVSFLYSEMIESIPSDHFLANRKDEGRAYLEMLRRVAGNHGILFVENAMKGIYWNKDFMSDSIHPNKPGYKKMQENISRALVKTFQKNAMLR